MTKPISISANDFRREPSSLQAAEISAFRRVLNSGWWVLGNEVNQFEEKWAAYSATNYAVGVANGLDALEISLRALGIGEGDEVITTPVTAYATTLAIQRCGAVPVFADIDPLTACISPSSIRSCITASTRAVLPVHLYGRCADLAAITEICEQFNLFLVEDCAQAHGAVCEGKPVGSIGHCGAWSFYPTKNLGAIGDAGAITTSDYEIDSIARSMRNYGQKDRYLHERIGLNSRLDELQAAILTERLCFLSSWTARRREIAAMYRARIVHPEIMHLAQESVPESNVYHLYVLRSHHRSSILEHLKGLGISCLIHYPLLSTQQKALGMHRVAPRGISKAIEHCATCFSLPIHPFLTDPEIDYVIQSVNSFSSSF